MARGGVVVSIALLQVLFIFLCDGQVMLKSRQCTYFGGGRSPKEAYSLSNCTWFKEQACCRHTEVTSVFEAMMPLDTSNVKCYNLMNYLMCYFCSPEQEQWYRGDRLHVCGSFCDKIYQQCKGASYNGKTIGNGYVSGQSFCEAQLFIVEESNKKCFDFDHSLFGASSHSLVGNSCLLFALLIFYIIRY